MGSVFFTEEEAGASFAALYPRPLRVTLLLERTVVPEFRSAAFVLRLVVAVLREVLLPVLRLVVLPVERLVRSFWVAVPVERAVEEPVLRLVRSFWFTVPAERVVEEPVERLVVLLPVERLVRSF